MGGGVAAFDYDNNGRLIFSSPMEFSKGADAARCVARQESTEVLESSLPAERRRDVYRRHGARGIKGSGYSMGAARRPTTITTATLILFVTGYGANHLYHNNGDGTFSDVTQKLSVDSSGWSTSAGWFDYDRDGRL